MHFTIYVWYLVINIIRITINNDTKWGRKKMTYNTINTGETCQKYTCYDNLKNMRWPSAVLSIFQNIQQSSNQVLVKNKAQDSIQGIRYVLDTEPSNLRPVKSWTIRIEEWKCTAKGTIHAKDILLIRVSNIPQNCDDLSYAQHIKDIYVQDIPMDVSSDIAFNAVMATSIFISKINAGRLPDIQKILSLYNLD